MEYNLTITVPGVFEGTIDQWADCFFSFPVSFSNGDCLDQIFGFCQENEWNVRVDYSKA